MLPSVLALGQTFKVKCNAQVNIVVNAYRTKPVSDLNTGCNLLSSIFNRITIRKLVLKNNWHLARWPKTALVLSAEAGELFPPLLQLTGHDVRVIGDESQPAEIEA